MGGSNPYIQKPRYQLPSKPYTLTVINHEHGGEIRRIAVDPGKLPLGDEGLPGSILDILLANGVDLNHACGGVCACSTCHVYIAQGASSCNPAAEAEDDMLDQAPFLKSNSRLGCQCVPNGGSDVTVEIPKYNRNVYREGQK